MTGPAVTAVIAAYRAGDYLRQAIASALAQTFTDLEVLISDDADDSEVRQLTESFGDPRIRYRSNPNRLGPARNHWAGFADARGRYLAVLNHDDVWKPEFLVRLLLVLDQDRDTVLAFCDHDVIDSDGRILVAETDRITRMWGRDKLSPGLYRPFPNLVARQSIPIAMGCLFRREAIDPTKLPDVGPAYDLWLAFALCRSQGGAYYEPERLTGWRVHPSQLTAAGNESWTRGALACWQAMDDDPMFRPVRQVVRGRLSRTASTLGIAKLMAADQGSARSFAWLALRYRPASWQAWAVLGLSILPRRVARGLARRRNHLAISPDPEGQV